MKFKKTQDSFRTILKIVIGVVFAVAILAISYKAATTSQENRSKAAETQVTYKSWEFNGTTTEGWLLTNLSGTRVTGGLLTAKVTGSPTSPVTLVNKSVGSVLPQGNKYIKLRLAVAGSTGSPPKSVSKTPINTKFPPPAPATPFAISVSYTNKGAPRVAPQLRGIADGKLYEYSVLLPDIGSVTVDSVKLLISSVKTGTPVQLDYVRLIGVLPPTPSPRPSIVCKTGVNTFSVDTPCTGGFQYMTFACYDGFSRREGGTTSCKTSDVWASYAKNYCYGRSNCSTTQPTPTPATPTPTATFPRPFVTSISSQNWKTGDIVTISGNYLLQPGPPVSSYKVYYSTQATAALYTVASFLPNQNNTSWEQTQIRFTVPILPLSTGKLTIMWGQPVPNLALPYVITINPTPTRYPTPIAQAACNYSCSTNLNCLSGLICYSGVCRNPSCIGQTNCSCPPGPTATPLVTPNPSKCVLNGGKCESLYTNCPTPDNQLPYDCGMGYRCIPSTMVCH